VTRLPIALAPVLVLVACAPVRAGWDLGSQGELAGRRTYALEPVSSAPGQLAGADLAERARQLRLMRTLILTSLTEKGYRLGEGSADFVVRYATGTEAEDGAPGGGDGSLRGRIDVHAVDPATQRWLWHGWATRTFASRLDRNDEIRAAVSEILSKFPPAS
jgi:hypothetical protein